MTSPVSNKTAQPTIETAKPREREVDKPESSFSNVLDVGANILKGTAAVAATVVGGPLAGAAVHEASKEIAEGRTALKG